MDFNMHRVKRISGACHLNLKHHHPCYVATDFSTTKVFCTSVSACKFSKPGACLVS